MTTILTSATSGEYAARGVYFTHADTVLLKNPPTLLRTSGTRIPLRIDPETDVSMYQEHEVRRVGADLVIRIEGVAWKADGAPVITTRPASNRMVHPRYQARGTSI